MIVETLTGGCDLAGVGRTAMHAIEQSVVVESAHPGAEDDQHVGTGALRRREGVRDTGRHGEIVAAPQGVDRVVDQDVQCAVEDVERLAGPGVEMRRRAGRTG